MPIVAPCQHHPGRTLTNFCSHGQCMVALCPECLPPHLRGKKCDGLKMEVLDDAVNKASVRGQESLRELSEQLNSLMTKREGILSQNQRTNMEVLESAKRELMTILEEFFEVVRKRMGVDDSGDKMKRTVRKYQKFREEIEENIKLLSNEGYMNEAIKTLFTIDTKAFLLNLRSETDFLFSQSSIFKVTFDPSCLHELRRNLENHIELKEHQVVNQAEASNWQQHFTLTLPDYFNNSCDFKIVHQFQPHSNSLTLVSLDNLNPSNNIKQKRLALSSFEVPTDSKSIITHAGDVYLLGGVSQSNKLQRHVHKLNFNTNSLEIVGSLIIGRIDPSVVYLGGNIYVVSGSGQDNQQIRHCEKFNLGSRQSVEISACRYPSGGASLAVYQDRYILKFGGVDSSNRFISVLQRYDTKRNSWSTLQLKFNETIPPKIATMFVFKPYSMAHAVSSDSVVISGGDENSPFNDSVAVLVEEQDGSFMVKEILPQKLPEKGFFLSTPVLNKRTLHAMESTPGGQKRLVITDLREWMSTN